MNSRRVFGEIDGKDKNQYPFYPDQTEAENGI